MSFKELFDTIIHRIKYKDDDAYIKHLEKQKQIKVLKKELGMND
jgi:phosphoribosyl-ATP pyrophosphohydrolase